MKFFFDVHLDKSAAYQLAAYGIDVVHCSDIGMDREPDLILLEHATAQERIFVTCDLDFELYHAEWLEAGKEHAGIVYFFMDERCKSVGRIVEEIRFLVEAADYPTDLYNKVWRVAK
ncbi:MAG: DUF5615 family PIN-like protein [Chloroflexi bacterium]|nr:DUF5615 family PIN-like protein [Chloroflexota bacterium]